MNIYIYNIKAHGVKPLGKVDCEHIRYLVQNFTLKNAVVSIDMNKELVLCNRKEQQS